MLGHRSVGNDPHLDDGLVGTKQEASDKNSILLRVSPNPARSESNLAYFLPFRSSVCLNLYDMNGRIVEKIDIGNQSRGEHTYKLKNLLLIPGNYILKLTLATANNPNDRSIFNTVKLVIIP
jgi:hypothetical protein